MLCFTDIPPNMIILYVFEGIWCRQEALRKDVVSNIVEDLDGRQRLIGVNKNQIREDFEGFQY